MGRLHRWKLKATTATILWLVALWVLGYLVLVNNPEIAAWEEKYPDPLDGPAFGPSLWPVLGPLAAMIAIVAAVFTFGAVVEYRAKRQYPPHRWDWSKLVVSGRR